MSRQGGTRRRGDCRREMRSPLLGVSLLALGCHGEPSKVVVVPAVASPERPAAMLPVNRARRFIAPPGEGPPLNHRWYQPPFCLQTFRLPLSDTEAAAIEARFVAWSEQRARKGGFSLRSDDQLMLFEKVGSSTGDKVAILGYDHSIFDHLDEPVTVEALRRMVVLDGGCSVWRVLYDVHTQSFESFECNGEA